MTNSQRLAEVRRCIDRWLEEQGCDSDVEIRESMLIRNGFYVGRRFKLTDYQAVWFIEEDEVKIHDATGLVLVRLDSAAIDMTSRAPIVAQPEQETGALGEEVPATIPLARMANSADVRRPAIGTVEQEVRRAA